MTSTRLKLLAGAGFVLVMVIPACSGSGDPADGETPVSSSAESEPSVADDGADARDDSTTEPEEPPADGQRIGGAMIGFTVELPEDWLSVPTDQNMIDAFVEQEDLPEDVGLSMHRVVQDGLGEGSLLAYGGTEDGDDIFLIASCEPGDDSSDDSATENATVDGIPAVRTSHGDSATQEVWLSYRFPVGDEACWVRFPAPDESWFAQFDNIVATIDVL